ncbi:MAG: hypothetical protein ACEPOV_14110 [Hyphomicrobiales bacterium]
MQNIHHKVVLSVVIRLRITLDLSGEVVNNGRFSSAKSLIIEIIIFISHDYIKFELWENFG